MPAHGTEKTEVQTNIRAGLKAVWRHFKPFKREMVVLVLLGLISAGANGAVPYITGRFFDALIAISQGTTLMAVNFPLWMVLLGIWVAIQLVANNIDWFLDRMRRDIDTRMHMNIQSQGFIHLFRLPLRFHKDARISEVLEQLSKAGWRIPAILRTAVNFAPQFLSIIVGIILAASINLVLAGVLLAGVLIYTALLLRIVRPMAIIDENAHRLWNESWGDSASAVYQVESVKQAVSEEYEIEKIKKGLLDKAYKSWKRLEYHWSNIGYFQRMLVFATQLVIFVLSVELVASRTITVGELIALNGYAAMFFGPFVQLGYNWQVIQNGITTAAQIESTFEEKEEAYYPEGGVTISDMKGAVEFDHVSFHYEATQVGGLTDISFRANPGEVVALVGESGVGKSTAVSLISGYFFPVKGSVRIDGIDTRGLNLIELRRHIAVVPQEIALFNDTVKENIRYGIFDASQGDIVYAAKEAHLADFIEGLPQQYETLVGERGLKLSVGQKQRIAIARAILRNPAILILDEPTSALDARTEQLVTESFEKLMQGRTTFIIAHRLSTVRKADRILVFEKGQIVEEGTHEELIKKDGGLYRRLYEYQIGLH